DIQAKFNTILDIDYITAETSYNHDTIDIFNTTISDIDYHKNTFDYLANFGGHPFIKSYIRSDMINCNNIYIRFDNNVYTSKENGVLTPVGSLDLFMHEFTSKLKISNRSNRLWNDILDDNTSRANVIPLADKNDTMYLDVYVKQTPFSLYESI
ncbi:MAG: hypothetical protein ACRCXT_13160, partial [Paraclostridium sp.]